MTRKGKIARLPRAVREPLNRRLQDGEPGKRLVDWLNSLPEVQSVLASEFGARPISEQNLTEWKQGGYREWLGQQELLHQARELVDDAGELTAASQGALADHLATVLTARYAGLMAGWDGAVDEEFRRKLRALRLLSQDVVELRRGDHSAARLKIEQERLREEQDRTEEELVEHFKRWVKTPKMRECICAGYVSPEEQERRMREMFGLAPQAPSGPAANGDQPEPGESTRTPAESNQIKPNQTKSNHLNGGNRGGNMGEGLRL